MNQLIIRRFIPSDTDQVKILNTKAIQAITTSYRGENWNKDLDNIENEYLHNQGEFLVGVIDHRIVAMGALFRISNETVELKRMRVDPEYQRKGYGRIMLEKLEQRAKELGYTIVQLDTTVKLVAAQKLYENNGYKEIKRETKGWPEETIFYQKRL